MQNIQKQNEEKDRSKSYSKNNTLPKKNVLGIGVTDASRNTILEYVVENVKKKAKPYYVVTPNPEMIVLAARKSEFKKVLNNANLALNDGIGISLYARMSGMSLKERFTGVEFVEKVCEKVADWPITVGFLGAGPGIAELTADCLKKKYPGLKVALAQQEQPENIVQNMPKVDILFVALGAPKQEFWMANHVGKIPVKVMVGVGGAFDYISGKVRRAPRIVRSIGFEWLFRLIVQPWRLKRQLALPVFAWMVLKEKLHW